MRECELLLLLLRNEMKERERKTRIFLIRQILRLKRSLCQLIFANFITIIVLFFLKIFTIIITIFFIAILLWGKFFTPH